MKLWEKIFLAITLPIIIFGSSLWCYWMYWPDHPLVQENTQAVKVDKAEYHAGDRVVYTISYCKTRPLPMKVNRALANDFRLTFAEVESDPPVGCHTYNYNSIIIPDFAPTGTYHLEATLELQINPIRKEYITWRSVDFEVRGNILNGIEITK